MEEGVEPPPGYRPNVPAVIQVQPNGITVDSLAALFQANAGIHAAALTALSQIDSSLIPNIERPIHTQVRSYLRIHINACESCKASIADAIKLENQVHSVDRSLDLFLPALQSCVIHTVGLSFPVFI